MQVHPPNHIIGLLGLCDEKDITMRGLEVLSLTSCLFHTASRSPHLLAGEQNLACLPRGVHQYIDGEQGMFGMSVIVRVWSALITTLTNYKVWKEAFYEKEIVVVDGRDTSNDILGGADKEDVSLLVVGNPFGYVFTPNDLVYTHDIWTRSLVPSRSGDFRTGFIGVLKMSAGSSPERLVQFVWETPHA